MEFVSLRTIIYDLLNIIRGAKIVDDEEISDRQLEMWVNQYRALLLKRDLDKGKDPNPAYIQSIDDVALTLDSDRNLYRTNIDIPKAIDLNYGSGILYVGDIKGNQIQLITESRAVWQKYKRFTQDDTVAFLNGNRIYIYNAKGLKSVYLRGVFEVPSEVTEANGNTPTYDDNYPIPLNMVPTLKEMILQKELGIEYKTESDNTNDSTNIIKK